MAWAIEREFGIPFMEVCSKLEDKDYQLTKMVKSLRDEIVNDKFPDSDADDSEDCADLDE